MPHSDDDPIWYASYGSNCHSARFDAYLRGTRADGAIRTERGARDPSPPMRSEPCWLPTTVRFVGESTKWGGGGIAFLDHPGHGRPTSRAPGRRYLITRGQFDDVVAQESRRDHAPIPVEELEPGEVTVLGDGFYDGLLRLEAIDGVPAATFTSPRQLSDRATNPPTAAYLGNILRGLLEVHTLGLAELVDIILEAPGVADGWDADSLAELASK